MKKALPFLVFCLAAIPVLFSQDNPITVKPYGYVSYEILHDTYRSLDSRDGELYFFPRKPDYDDNGIDINKRSKFNMLTVQSRLGFRVSGPDIFGAKASGVIEGDFFGTQQEYVRQFRLRLALISLQWSRREILMGHGWHPFFVLDCSPSTVSFAAAVPFHPLNRSPQIRFTQKLTDNFSVSSTYLVHGYHSSAGPNDQQRNSGMPESVLQLRFQEGGFLLGATAGYKYLSPRDKTTPNTSNPASPTKGVATNKKVGSYSLQAFSKITTAPVTVKVEGIYGENLSHFVMIGGYGVKATPQQAQDPEFWLSDYDYANINSLALWTDIHSNSTVLQWGIFAGYTQNLGSKDPLVAIPGTVSYQRFTDVSDVLRISPRVVYFRNNFSFGAEVAYYNARYADTFNEFRKPVTLMDPAVNFHTILFSKYTF
jgi:hypothetical protein